MKKLWKYIAGLLTIAGGILIAFLSGKGAGRSDEKQKDIKKKIKTAGKIIKKNKKEADVVKESLKSKKKALEEIKKQKEQFGVERKSSDEAADFLKKYAKKKK
jgi:septal ring factor EnvC (AmiA/AmiB activator)